ncbi:MAG: porin [Planctomycetota bacterium]
MKLTSVAICVALFALTGIARASSTADDLKQEVEKLRKEIAQKQESRAPINGKVDALVGGKYGPNTPVTTKSGNLEVGGLLQVWYMMPQKDKRGIFQPAPGNNIASTVTPLGESFSYENNDTYRIRRTELHCYVDIHENVSAYILMDPARESNLYYLPLPTFQLHNEVFANPITSSSLGGPAIRPQVLQDAYINYHGVVPHHDFTIGQMIPPVGEEAYRNSGQLDFVERAMVTAENKVRDIGVMMHGTWLDDRVDVLLAALKEFGIPTRKVYSGDLCAPVLKILDP